MKPASLYLDGSPITPGKRLGRGGEGDVFMIDDGTGRALKLYTVSDLAEREAKVQAMVRGGLAAKSSLVAFPIAPVRSADGRFVGFVMRSVVGHKPLFELYGPAARKRQFPDADYRFLIRVAANVARAIATVHESGCVIGDINHSGILVSKQAVAALIDADSFQFTEGGKRHACRVGVPEYTPPELQGSSLRDVERSRSHDEFGLAVVIFQLLFLGRHPYAGTYVGTGDMPIQTAIGENRFAYSRMRNSGMSPPPHAGTLDDVPQEVADAFEAAFAPGGRTRPTAARWASLLHELERRLRRCGAKPEHLFATSAAECPWCRMERGLGITLFLPKAQTGVGSGANDAAAGAFDFAVVWASIEAVQIPRRGDVQPVLRSMPAPATPSAAASAAIEWRNLRRLFGGIAVVAAAAGLYFASTFILIWLGMGAVGLHQLLTAEADTSEARSRHAAAVAAWEQGLEGWRGRCGSTEIGTLFDALRRARADYLSLPDRERVARERYEADRWNQQLSVHLERQQIRNARIDGVGAPLVMQLASHGIETARDVVAHHVSAVPGFGPVKTAALLTWRRSAEAKFRFSTVKSPRELADVDRIRNQFAAEGSTLRRTLAAGAGQLRTATETLKLRAAVADPQLERLHAAVLQREADLTLLGVPIPNPAGTSRPSAAPRSPPVAGAAHPAPVQAPSAPTPASGTTCPRCSGRMVVRTARRGRNPGRRFWGCAAFPSCQGTRPL